jgi:hypothetical protein
MRAAPAMKVAIDLMHMPSRVRLIRSEPLPDGVLLLLQIAAGDQGATGQAAELTGRSHSVVRDASAFFIEQILLGPDTDSYRRLGASPQATSSELRRNMALLLSWLHPDLDRQGDRSVFARRVIGAWDDLKTSERRAAYDAARRTLSATKLPLCKPSTRAPSGTQEFKKRPNNSAHYERWNKPGRALDTRKVQRTGFLRRLLLFLFGRARR